MQPHKYLQIAQYIPKQVWKNVQKYIYFMVMLNCFQHLSRKI